MITADTIKATRLWLGEHQGAFAKRFAVNQSTVQRWETAGPPQAGPTRALIERVLAELPAAETPPTAPAGGQTDPTG